MASRRDRHHVEAASLQHQRGDGKAGEEVVTSLQGRLPEPVMGGQVAIGGAELGKPRGDEFEMRRHLIGDLDPIVEEAARQIGRCETRDQVPGEVDGIELDMGEGVEEGDAPR